MNDKSIKEINAVIAKIEKALEPGCEIGARERTTLRGLLKTAAVDKKAKFFTCQRENSGKILHYFVKEKGVPQSRFSTNAQPDIFLLF